MNKLANLMGMFRRKGVEAFYLAVLFVTAVSCTSAPLVSTRSIKGDMSVIEFSRTGQVVAEVATRADELPSGDLELVVEIPARRVNVSSITLLFASNSGDPSRLPMAYKVSGYVWSYEFHSAADGVLFHVPDTGTIGKDTMDFRFMLPQGAVPENGIRLQATLKTGVGQGIGLFDNVVRSGT